MSGLAPDLKYIAEGMIRGSMGLIESMRGARDTAIALGHELARQHGMAGDDDAGRAFAKVYGSAASATLNQMGFSSYVLGETSRGLMRTAREFMSQESKLVSQFLGKQVDLTVGVGDPGADCTENYLGSAASSPRWSVRRPGTTRTPPWGGATGSGAHRRRSGTSPGPDVRPAP